MIAGFLPAAHTAIYARPHQATGQRGAQQQMVDAQARVAGKGISVELPEGIDALVRMKRPHGIEPALRSEAIEGGPDLRAKQRVILPTLRRIDVKVGRQ